MIRVGSLSPKAIYAAFHTLPRCVIVRCPFAGAVVGETSDSGEFGSLRRARPRVPRARKGITMKSLGFSYESLHRQAVLGMRRAARGTCGADADDHTQEALARFIDRGMLSLVDAGKGTARSLAGGVLRNVRREDMRERQRHAAVGFHDGLVDHGTLSALDNLIEKERQISLEHARRFLVVWWNSLTKRQQMALVRIRGVLFGLHPDRAATSADHTAACRAMKKLHEMAVEADMIEG